MEYLIHILIISGIYIILTLSLNLIIGYTGLSALGHIAFAAVGAYTSSLLALNFGISPFIGLLVGAVAASFISLVIVYPALRLKGDYLALATFGFGIIIYTIIKNLVNLTKGPMGLPGIPTFSIFGYEISNAWSWLILVFVFVFTTYKIIKNITHSPFGRILQGIREDEIATMAMGKNINKHKLIVFVVGAFFAGIAGSLYAHYITFIDPSTFTSMESISILLMVVFGGMGDLKGSVIGATILVVFPELLRFLGLPSSIAAPIRQMLYGLLLVVIMLARPQGILGKFKFK